MAARLYDWEEWFNRGQFVLRWGEDYSVPSSLMAQQVRNAAQRWRKGHWCKIRKLRDGEGLVVEVLPRSGRRSSGNRSATPCGGTA